MIPILYSINLRANKLSLWVASMALWFPTVRERVQVLTKFINIASVSINPIYIHIISIISIYLWMAIPHCLLTYLRFSPYGCIYISYLIESKQHLRSLRNFNTLMGLLAGMSVSAIFRLKSTWEKLEPNVIEVNISIINYQIYNQSEYYILIAASVLVVGYIYIYMLC